MPLPGGPGGAGVYSGAGAAFVDASGTMIVPNYKDNMAQNVPYPLTYTFTSDDGCEDTVTIMLMWDAGCDADGGRF